VKLSAPKGGASPKRSFLW